MTNVDEKYLEEVKDSIREYVSGERIPTLDDAISECHGVIIRSIFDSFGLSGFGDKIGGNSTTVHNFKKGITANDEEYARYLDYKKGYDSTEVRPKYTNIQSKKRWAIVEDLSEKGENIISGYTGKELPLDKSTQLEHIVSVEEIYSDPALHLAFGKEGFESLIYDDTNLTMLESDINQSKGGTPLKEWLFLPSTQDPSKTNAEFFGVDVERALALDKRARLNLGISRNAGLASKQAPEILIKGLEQGKMLAVREVTVAILIDLYEAMIPSVRSIVEMKKSGQLTWDAFFDEVKTAMINIKDKVLRDWQDFIKIYFSGFRIGVLSSVVTFVINCFLTTVKNVVTIIRETLFCFFRIAQIKANKVLTDEEKNTAIRDMLISTFTVCLTALLGEAIYLKIAELPYSSEISQAIAAILVGVTIVLVSYLVLSMQEELLSMTASGVELGVSMVETVDNHERRIEAANERMRRLLGDD